MATYAHPEVLVETDWVEQHKAEPNVRLVEVDVDTTAYDQGHIQGAVGWNWTTQTQDPVRRDVPTQEQFEKLMSEAGINRNDTVVLYGDNNNWFAAYAFWLLKLYGHPDVRLMNGGRKKWLDEKRQTVTDKPSVKATSYKASKLDESLRAYAPDVKAGIGRPERVLVDVRSAGEYKGEVMAPPGLPETAQRMGRIPGAKSIPWAQVMRDDATFKPADELEKLYSAQGVTKDKDIVAYCRIGERSSHSWFVLKYLLGYNKVRNYDGSWTEWGSMVGNPIEKG
jgi:thiosulfate/3-mercaptopyruvate sulfurtransferase